MEYHNKINDTYLALVRHSVLQPVFKIELLDDNEQAYKEIITHISVDSSGSISATYQQGVQKTISLTLVDPEGHFLPNPNNEYFWIGRKFKVYLGLARESTIQNMDTTDVLNTFSIESQTSLDHSSEIDYYWFSKGVYILTSIDASRSNGGETVSISGVDKFGRFTSDTGFCEMIANFVIPKGMLLSEAIQTILNQDDGRGKPIDPIAPFIDPYYADTRIPLEVSKGAGSYMGDIMIELASMYKADIFYDNDGRFVFRRAMLGDENMQLPIVWEFDDGAAEYINSSLSYDFTSAINTIYVVGDNPNTAVAPEAFLQNTNPQSPLTVDKIGAKSKLLNVSTIQTKQEAEDYAEYMLNQLSRVQQSVPLTCTFIPHLDVNTLFTLTDSFYKMEKEPFFIQSITYPIGLGTMSLQSIDLKELPTY